MKCSIVLFFVLLAVCASTLSAQSHNITWGTIGSRDILLDREIIVKKYKFLQIVTEDITFPGSGKYNRNNITGIRCIDQYVDGDGGHATLLKGGPGYQDVTIHFKSQRNHGFNFILEIFGH